MNVQTETLKSLRKDIKPSLSPGFPRFLDPWWSLALSLALFIFPEIHRTQGPRNRTGSLNTTAWIDHQNDVRATARSLRLELVEFDVVGGVLERAFDAFAERQVGAVFVDNFQNLIAATPVIVRLEQQHKIPTIYPGTVAPRAGGLMGYANRDQGLPSYRQAASALFSH